MACRLRREARLLQLSDTSLPDHGLTRDDVREQLIEAIRRC